VGVSEAAFVFQHVFQFFPGIHFRDVFVAVGFGAVEQVGLNFVEQVGNVLGDAIERCAGLFFGVAAGHFDLAGGEVALAEAEAHGDADHLIFGKFEARAVLVVVVNFDRIPLARSSAAIFSATSVSSAKVSG
jgi:hypothetical protein